MLMLGFDSLIDSFFGEIGFVPPVLWRLNSFFANSTKSFKLSFLSTTNSEEIGEKATGIWAGIRG